MFVATDDPAYKPTLLNAIVAPRPIGWISTVDGDGNANLAPFSYFNGVSSTPPMVVFCVNEAADRAEKDTLSNVRDVPEFVANLVTWDLREAMNLTAALAPAGTSEFEIANLATAPSHKVKPPSVAASPSRLECRVIQIVDIPPSQPGERMSSLVIGRVLGMYIDDKFLVENGRFDTVKAQPISRMGGFSYTTLGEVFEMPRPSWPLESK